ncbi:MAG TPA: hypothetical protein VFB67_09095 [Candidatus Polarisedimenticolaceae bacterium]|nr:hypothetical protein [Candidatus Polarisedimenticolaceae bacterium]
MRRIPSSASLPILGLFLVSGAASLLLETVYRRQLALVLGSSVVATSVTLAVFLGGLAIGAALFGSLADRAARPLRLYARLEIGAALGGAAALVLLERATSPLAIALLLPPTICMGGTLPALTRQIARGRRMLRPVAVLYGVNTLGAAIGAGLSGFVLFETLGVRRTGWLGVTLAAAAGVAAAAIDRGTEPAADEEDAAVVSAAGAGSRAAVACAAIGGAAALGYEVVWTRILALPLRSYSYSFSLMLALFLVGLVAGTLVVARLAPRIEDPMRALAVAQLAAGAYVAASVFWLPALLKPAAEGAGFGAFVLNGLIRAGPVVLPPTFLSGMALPLAARAFVPSSKGAGRGVGWVYAMNTAGSIAGALLAGLVALPTVGASRALVLCGVLGATAGAVAGFRSWPVASVAIVGACAVALARPPGAFVAAFAGAGRSAAPTAPLYFREGATDTVAVVRRDYGFRDPDAKSVIVNGIAMTATVKPVWRYMAAEGHLPALLAPQPCRGLVICVGTGITLEALASHAGVTSVDAVDLSESMLGALPVFEKENRGAFHDPKVTVVHDDGRHALARSPERYGAITLEPPPPIVAGSVHLYTLDFYRLCRKRLVPAGVVAQWLPLHAQSLASARATARTFLEAFPHVQLWLPSIRDAVLVGSEAPLHLDPARLRAAYASPASRESLEAAYFETPEALLATLLLEDDGVAAWCKGADLITDDRPSIEFFRRYGRTMSDHDIATLLGPARADLSALLAPPAAPRAEILTAAGRPLDAPRVPDADAALTRAAERERGAHLLYLRSEIEDDAKLAREAARAARSTRFGLYRLGCDVPQLEALRLETGGSGAWRRQVEACRRLTLGE